ncbi:MAG: hypothetical protein ACRDIC_01425 [bacterium]
MPDHILDGDRLLADLQAAGEVLDGGEWPNRAAQYYELRGIQRAWRILAAAVEDGEYDLDPAVAEFLVDVKKGLT